MTVLCYLGAFSMGANKTRTIEKANDRARLPNLDQRDGLEPPSWSWMTESDCRLRLTRPRLYH